MEVQRIDKNCYVTVMQKEHSSRRAFGYVRVSTLAQSKDGESISVQTELVRQICALENLVLVELFVEEVSGSRPLSTRPQGKKLLAQLQPGDVVVALRLDRAFRDTADALATLKDFRRKGVGLYLRDLGGFVAGDSVGELLFGLMSTVAAFERSRTRERVVEVRQSLRAQSRFLGGGTPFGFRVVARGGERYVEPDALILEEVMRLRSAGYSSRLISGHFAQRGVPVSHHAVARLLRRMSQQIAA